MMRPKRANVCWPMVFDGGFRLRKADAETDGKCHRRQARRARQEPDALTFEREINGLSGSGRNLNEAVGPTNLEAGVRAILWLEQSGRQRFAP